ncbi:protein ALP1-like [Zingiber officinale]|uniref:protein ALP1-like n=1 Tax=Zingiber officinale TaxID=94328 RepID=UPI001C4D901C|nr:protein ALP1-like [Zingiber officinale]
MTRPPFNSRSQNLMCTLWVTHIILMAVMVLIFYQHSYRIYRRTKICRIKNKEEKRIKRMQWIFSLTKESDAFCISELRMDRRTFEILCDMVRDIGGLKDTRNASVDEIVAFFIYVLAHHKKNRTISLLFHRSQETVSRHFNLCLHAILKLHHILLQTPEPISENCEDDRWKPFKGCLGALDGTFIPVTPPKEEKQRYRTRKGGIATNVLGVCSPNMQFIYVLPGWEGSAHDGRVLRDAISRPTGLKVPQGCYYLVDAGYCNSSGFLAPYRGHRYHLNEFDGHRPETPEEYFNMKHSRARNVIERCFGLLKGRWKILASPSFFPIQTQVRIIISCCLLHNLIRKFMSTDPQESIEDDEESEDEESDDDDEVEYIRTIAPTDQWNAFRNNMAIEMFNNWRNGVFNMG